MTETTKRIFDLEERTTSFGEQIIEFCRPLPINTITSPIINQLVKSATSIGANYMEANGASSKRDFKNKISIVKKECRETKYWLRILLKYFENKKQAILPLYDEARQLTLIFSKISNSLK